MLSSKSAKYWYKIKQKNPKVTIKDTPLKDSDDLLELDFHDYFILNRVLHWTKPKEIGWVGGFTNLDFFISQKDVSGIKKCINFDGTPAGKWCSKKHKKYIEQYQFEGDYVFINKNYNNTKFENINFLSTICNPFVSIDFKKITKLKTLVLHHFGSPCFINLVKDSINGLPQKIITENLVIYTSENCKNIFKDIQIIEQISNSDIFYNLNNTIFTKNMPKDLSHDSLSICIKQKYPFPWDKRIQEIK